MVKPLKLHTLFSIIENSNNHTTRFQLHERLKALNPIFEFQKEEKILTGRFYNVHYTAVVDQFLIHALIHSSADHREKFEHDYPYSQLYPRRFSKVRIGHETIKEKDFKIFYLE